MYNIGLVIFPGSNCDAETYDFLKSFPDVKVTKIWHKETELKRQDMYILPGGFSYGDYLRPGKLASMSPALTEINRHATIVDSKVLGICNGFQILCEMGLLPGTLRKNNNLQFICKTVNITCGYRSYDIPIAHGDGNFYCEKPEYLNVAYWYTNNPNGSTNDIAGIYNRKGNVLGMMPHPERAWKEYHASQHGIQILENFIST